MPFTISFCIFDVSAVRKTFLLDVYTVLRMNNVDNIFAFELKKRGRSYDDKELIHNLSFSNGEYDYCLLSNTNCTSGSIVKSADQSELESICVDEIERIIDSYADEVARIYLSLLFVCSLVVLAGCIYIVLDNGWDWLEAWTFIVLVPVVYVLSTGIKIVWGIDFTANPGTLHKQFKRQKSRKIKKRMNLIE